MRVTNHLIVLLIILESSCSSRKSGQFLTVDKKWLDSIKSKSDTHYVKKYRNIDFVTAEYYVNKKDTIVSQFMKDSAGVIRQIIISGKNKRIFIASYYPNGQLMAKLSLDEDGRFHGPAKYFYENGLVRMEGSYNHGFFFGEWINYDENGKANSKEEYNEEGELIKKTKIN